MTARSERYRRVLVAVLAVVPGPEGTVTFVRQRSGPFAGNWLLPGGGVEVGECARDAVAREVLEETGCLLREPEPFAIYEIIGRWPGGETFHLNMSCFHAGEQHEVSPGFRGHNVDEVRQADPSTIPLHSTDWRILTDAGVVHEPEDAIARRLANDGLVMNTLLARQRRNV